MSITTKFLWRTRFSLMATKWQGQLGAMLTAEADARLIAAAPDLLEAADMARAVLEVVVPCNEAERLALAMCRAAIAKAKGA